MKKIRHYGLIALSVICCLVFMGYPVFADDTCVFSVTADDLPPNIVLLLDSGAEMEQIVWHSDFNNNTDYTPNVITEIEAGQDPFNGNGFFNDKGYGIVTSGGSYYLVNVPDDIQLAHRNFALKAFDTDSTARKGTWIINGKPLTLPAEPSNVAVDGVIDNAHNFRYSKNYLNWLFFHVDVSTITNGADLPAMSRFYDAKKAIMTVAKGTGYKAKFSIYYFANEAGGSQAQPLKFVVNADGTLTSEFINNINNMRTVTYSPLAEGLSSIGYYLSSPSSGASGGYCQKNFSIVISPGVSSEDRGTTSQHVPDSLSDYDGDGADGGVGEGYVKEDSTLYKIPVNLNGSTYLDDVAYYLYSHDIVGDAPSSGSLCYDSMTNSFSVGDTVTGGSSGATGNITAVNMDTDGPSGCLELNNLSGNFLDNEPLTVSSLVFAMANGSLYTSGEGFQNVLTYTIGFMSDRGGDLFLINTSNNGNGYKNLYDTSDEDYRKYHFTAQSSNALSAQLMEAVNDILTRTSTFMAPVVPVTRTTSGDKIYMAFFKPNNGNFWEGNVTKYGISLDNRIVDANGNPATWPNGAMRDDAVPYWATIDWANVSKSNYLLSRTIYTCLDNTDLTSFDASNSNLTATILGNSTRTPADIINYVRGADILDEDGDNDLAEYRAIITGDVLHSEPLIFQYRYADGTSKTMVYFGSNDGMLHAVLDEEKPSGPTSPGLEMWAFIPPDQLSRLKDMIEGVGHQSYVDSTPRIYFKDVLGDGFVDTGDQVILICGERKGGKGYFALDVTDPFLPKYLWRINKDDGATLGIAPPTTKISELGETWSEPQFGLVKTTDTDTTGTAVFFIGGGYSSDNSSGNAVIAVNVITGEVVRKFTTGMNYSFPSSVLVVDENDNGFVDKVYVGDLGGQMWRFASFTDSSGNLTFPDCNENINDWNGQIFFKTDDLNSRKFYYPPSVTLEKGYDMVFMGTGDRENTCCNNDSYVCPSTGPNIPDIITAVKETHSSNVIVGETDVAGSLYAQDLVDVTDPSDPTPNLANALGDVDSNGSHDQGWYIRLVDASGDAVGEKVLAEGTVFYKTFYITTFTPNDDPCVPGGDGTLYALSYLTGAAVLDFDHDSNNDRSIIIGGGIPSKPVTLITTTGTKLLISVGSSNPDAASPSLGAGVRVIDPLLPPANFFYRFWREIF